MYPFSQPRIRIIQYALLVALCLLVYANSLHGDFVLDDYLNIRDNRYIQHWSSFGKLFTTDMGAGAQAQFFYYRPLVTASYMLTYAAWGLDTFGYHLTSIVLHLCVCLLLFRLVFLLFDNNDLAFLAALFFVVHPIHSQTVAYISNRGELLVSLWVLLSSIAYVSWIRQGSTSDLFSTLLFFICALLTKETALVIPVLFFAYTRFCGKKAPRFFWLCMGGIVCIYGVFRFAVLSLPAVRPEWLFSLLQRVPGAFAAVILYARILLVPVHLHLGYGKDLFAFSEPRVIAGVLLVMGLFFWAWRSRTQHRVITFSIGWFFIMLLPYADIYPPLPFYAADHHIYLASLGYFVLIAYAVLWLLQHQNTRRTGLACVIVLVLSYATTTIFQNYYWSGPEVFNKRTLHYVPHDDRAYNNLGKLYSEQGKYELALQMFKQAIALRPKKALYHYNAGESLRRAGFFIQAGQAFESAIALDPSYAPAYEQLGVIFFQGQAYEQAIELFQRAVHLDPEFVKAYNNLGSAYATIGKYSEAIKAFQKALAADPSYREAYDNLKRARALFQSSRDNLQP